MLEWLTELLLQTCVCLLGFACGCVWMRGNYIRLVNSLLSEIERATMNAGKS